MEYPRVRMRPAFLASLIAYSIMEEGLDKKLLPFLLQLAIKYDNSRWKLDRTLKSVITDLNRRRLHELIRDYEWSIVSRIPANKREVIHVIGILDKYYRKYEKVWNNELPDIMRSIVKYEILINEREAIVKAVERTLKVLPKNNILIWVIEPRNADGLIIYESPDRGLLSISTSNVLKEVARITSRICLESIGFIKRDIVIHPNVRTLIKHNIEELWKNKRNRAKINRIYEDYKEAGLRFKGPKVLMRVCTHWNVIEEISVLPYRLIKEERVLEPKQVILRVLDEMDIEERFVRFPLNKFVY